jgi:hypothetical protein
MKGKKEWMETNEWPFLGFTIAHTHHTLGLNCFSVDIAGFVF